MNKHNVIELCDYRENKYKVKFEHQCFGMLDSLSDRIKMSETYAKSFKQYLEVMVKDRNIKKSFADNINAQVDMMMSAAHKEFKDSKLFIK